MSRVQERVAALTSGVRFGQFVSVGAVGFVFDVTTATLLAELGVFPELAAFVGIEVAIVVMFMLNDNWTFADQGRAGLRPKLRRLVTSNLVRAGGIVVQLATFSLVFRLLHVELDVLSIDGWFVVSKALGITAGMVVNYVAESLLTWRVHDEN